MSTLLGYDCQKDKRNIGVESCGVKAGNETGHIRMPKGFTIDLDTVTFDLDYVNDQIQQGNFEFITNCFSQITETPDDQTETSPLGKMAVTQKGLGVTTSIVKKGYEFHASVYGEFSDTYDVMPVFQNNIIQAARTGTTGNVIKGFSVGMYSIGGWQNTNGSVSAQTTIKYQFDDAYELNTMGVYLTNLPFNANTGVNNIVDLTMTGRADVSNALVYVKAVWARNPQLKIATLSSANFKATIGGVPDTIVDVTYNPSTFEYEIELTTAFTISSSIVISTNDATASPAVGVAKVVNKFYKGTTSAITPVA